MRLPSEAPTSGPAWALASTLASILAAFVLVWADASGAAPPPEDTCPTLAGAPTSARAEDAMAAPLHEGSAIGTSDLLALKDLFPPEVWKYRDVFFHEGMRMEIGGCHRRYPLSAWYTEASQRYAGRAHLDDDGNLRDYTAGVPFAPDSIDPKQADAGVRWAWNFEERYTGAGPVGSFRLLDLPSRVGTPETYKGTFFLVRTAHRADLASSEYRVPEAKDRDWVGGGEFDEPFNARFLAWRQLRPTKSERRYQEPDDTFVYVPTMRKVRRAAASWVDGFYTPRYAASGDSGGGGVPFGAGEFGPTGAINPTAGNSIAATDHVRRGFVGLSLRPNAYDWSYVGERAVLAPLNGVRPGYPESPDRNYGPSGLSVGSDRWDLRWAVVIEGRARRVVEDVGFVTLYIDYQTQQLLYLITHRPNRLLLEVGIFVHRYSGDLPRYATFPDGGQANVFDPVAAVFYEVREGGSGWRRESYDVQSVPVDPNRLRQMTSTDDLLRGR